MRRLIALLVLGFCVVVPAWAQQPVNVSQVGSSAISLYSTLFNATAATATATSSAVRIPSFSGNGTLQITGASITGSPSGCHIALAYQPYTGSPPSSTEATISFTPGNSTQLFAVNPTDPSGDQYVATYTCGTYPTAGTISASFAPTGGVAIVIPLPAGTNNLGQIDIVGHAGATFDAAPGATAPTNGLSVGGVYNSSAPTPSTGQFEPLQLDANGNLQVNVKAGSSGNAAASATGSSVPADADYAGLNVSGNLRGQTGVNPSGSIYAAQIDLTSVGGTPVVTGTGASGSGIPRVTISNDSSLAANQSVNVNQVGGAASSATNPLYVGIADGANGPAAVKAASTQAAAADKSLVVQLNPNQPNLTTPLNVSDVGTLANNGAAAATNRVATLPGVAQTSPANGTAYTQGRDAAPNVGTDGNLWASIQPALRPASFVASAKFAGSSTTDNAVLPGNASNTVLVTRVLVSCTQTTAGIVNLSVIKRSAADTSGTSASMTAVPDDSTFSAAVSAPLSYTGTGPSAGTAVGNVDTYQLGCNASATAGPNDIYILDRRLKPIVLRGTAQELAVNFGGAITGGNLTVTYEWEEVATITP